MYYHNPYINPVYVINPNNNGINRILNTTDNNNNNTRDNNNNNTSDNNNNNTRDNNNNNTTDNNETLDNNATFPVYNGTHGSNLTGTYMISCLYTVYTTF